MRVALIAAGILALIVALPSRANAEEGGASVVAQPQLATGSWGETVTIVVPPAPRDSAPKVSLVENHNQIDSEVGSGWTLNATSVIRRRSATNGVPSIDGSASLFVVDGMELVAVTGPGGAHYQPETYDGSRFELNASTKQWTRKRNGWLWTYGAVTNSTRLIVAAAPFPACPAGTSWCNIESWYLSSVVDPFGNRADFTYDAPAMPSALTPLYPGIAKTGERLVKTITYAANNATITFDYSQRPDLRLDLSGGTPVFRTQRLSKISSAGASSAFYSRYIFIYEDQGGTHPTIGTLRDCDGNPVDADPAPQRSLLRGIHRVGTLSVPLIGTMHRLVRCNEYFHGETAWTDKERVDADPAVPESEGVTNPFDDMDPTTPGIFDLLKQAVIPIATDLDGDGRTDLVVLGLDTSVVHHRVFIATPNRADAFADSDGTDAASITANDWEAELNASLELPHFTAGHGHAIIDLDGDGGQELVVGGSSSVTIKRLVAPSIPNVGPASWAHLGHRLDKCDLNHGQFADIDGDRRPDLVIRPHGEDADGCLAEVNTRWIRNAGADAWWFDSASASTLSMPLEAGTLPTAWSDALDGCGGTAVPPADHSPDWILPEAFVADQARFDDFNADGVADVAYALYGCWETINEAPGVDRWVADKESVYSRIFFGNGHGVFIDSGISAGPPVLLDPYGSENPSLDTFRLTQGLLATADLDRDGHPEVIQTTPDITHPNYSDYGLGAWSGGLLDQGYSLLPEPAAAPIPLWDTWGTAWDCFKQLRQPVWGDFDGDGFPDKLNIEWNGETATPMCPINTWCVVLEHSTRDVAEGRLVESDNEFGGRSRLTWGFSAELPNTNPELSMNLEVLQGISSPAGGRAMTYHGATRTGDRITPFEQVTITNDRGGVETYTFITALFAAAKQHMGVRLREDGSVEHVTVILHGELVGGSHAVSLTRPYFNPVIRRCEFDVGFAQVDLDALDLQCEALPWLGAGVPGTPPGSDDVVVTTTNRRLVYGHDRSPADAAQRAVFAKVWGRPAAGSGSHRPPPRIAVTDPPSHQNGMGSLDPGSVALPTTYYRWPISGLIAGSIPDVEQQEQAYAYPALQIGTPIMYAWDYGFDHANRKLVKEYQHRDTSTAADDRQIAYTWIVPAPLTGYWYQLTTAWTETGGGAPLSKLTRTDFAGFDVPKTVTVCGTTATDCRTDKYTFTATGMPASHTLPDNTSESWTRLAWCGAPLFHSDTLGRIASYERDSRCLTTSSSLDGATQTFTYDDFMRPLKHVIDPGVGESGTATMTSTYYYDDDLAYSETMDAREDAGYREPRHAERRSDGRLDLVYEDGLGRVVRRTACTDVLGNSSGGDIQLVSCAFGSQRHVEWTLYGNDGSAKVSIAPFAAGEAVVSRGVAHDGQGRVIVSIDPAHSPGPASWTASTILYGAGYENRTEPTAAGTRTTRYSHSTLSSAITVGGVARGSETFNAMGLLSTRTAPDGKITRYEYDTQHRLARTSLVDVNGGLVTEECVLPNGATANRSLVHTIVARDLRDRVRTEVLPDGTMVEYAYDNADRPRERRVNGTLTTSYAYEAPTALTKGSIAITDELGGSTSTTYVDALRRPWGRRAARLEERMRYNSAGLAEERVDELTGRVTSYHRDGYDRITSTSSPGRGTTTFTYGGADRLATVTDADGVLGTFAYTYAGDPYQRYGGSYLMSQRTYDVQGQLVSALEDGVASELTHDSLGRTTMLRQGVMGPTELRRTSWIYDDGDRVTEVHRSPVENMQVAVTEYRYDRWGRNTMIVDPDGHPVTMKFDQAGRVRFVTDQELGRVETRYDELGRVTDRQLPGAGWEHFAYVGHQTAGGTAGVWRLERWDDEDAARNVRRARYVDGTGHVLEEIERDGTKVLSTWLGDDLLRREIRTSAGAVHRATDYTYDPVTGRLAESATGPYLASYEYTAAGRLTAVHTPDDDLVRTYDNGLLSTETQAGVTSRYYRGTAESWIRLEERQAGTGPIRQTEIGRDGLGRIVRAAFSTTLSGLPQTRTFEDFDYYDHPRYEKTTDGVTDVVENLAYDKQGRPTVRRTNITGLPPRITTWTWLENGMPDTKTTPSGLVLEYEYGGFPFDYQLDRLKIDGVTYAEVDARDLRGSITALDLPQAPGGQTRLFRFDDRGRVDGRRSGAALPGPGLAWSATFDPDGKLATEDIDDTTVGGASWNNAYGYDDAGRLVHEESGRTGTVYDYVLDDAGNRLETHDGTGAAVMTATYDGPKLVDVDGIALAYDAWNAVAGDHHGNVYHRSADGELLRIGSGAVSNVFLRNARGIPVSAEDAGATRRTTWELDPGGLPLEIDAEGAATLTYIKVEGMHVGTLVDGTAFVPVDADARGTELRHGAEALGFATAFGEGVVQPAGADERFLFAMLESTPAATDVMLARHRTYDPTTGRFLEIDPLGARGGAEVYQYGNGDPINFVDPMGLSPITGDDCDTTVASMAIDIHALSPAQYSLDTTMVDLAASTAEAIGMTQFAQQVSRVMAGAPLPGDFGKGPLCVVNCMGIPAQEPDLSTEDGADATELPPGVHRAPDGLLEDEDGNIVVVGRKKDGGDDDDGTGGGGGSGGGGGGCRGCDDDDYVPPPAVLQPHEYTTAQFTAMVERLEEARTGYGLMQEAGWRRVGNALMDKASHPTRTAQETLFGFLAMEYQGLSAPFSPVAVAKRNWEMFVANPAKAAEATGNLLVTMEHALSVTNEDEANAVLDSEVLPDLAVVATYFSDAEMVLGIAAGFGALVRAPASLPPEPSVRLGEAPVAPPDVLPPIESPVSGPGVAPSAPPASAPVPTAPVPPTPPPGVTPPPKNPVPWQFTKGKAVENGIVDALDNTLAVPGEAQVRIPVPLRTAKGNPRATITDYITPGAEMGAMDDTLGSIIVLEIKTGDAALSIPQQALQSWAALSAMNTGTGPHTTYIVMRIATISE